MVGGNGIEVVGAGCTSTLALEVTADDGIELLLNWVLMLASVNAFAVAVACAAPFSCSITTVTMEVANSLLAGSCRTLKNIRHLSHTTGSAELPPQVPQLARFANTLMIACFFKATSAADNASAIPMETVYTLSDFTTHELGGDQV